DYLLRSVGNLRRESRSLRHGSGGRSSLLDGGHGFGLSGAAGGRAATARCEGKVLLCKGATNRESRCGHFCLGESQSGSKRREQDARTERRERRQAAGEAGEPEAAAADSGQ